MYDTTPTDPYGGAPAPQYDAFAPDPSTEVQDPTQGKATPETPDQGQTPGTQQPSPGVSREQFEEHTRRYDAEIQRLKDEVAAARASHVTQQPQYQQQPQPQYDPNQAKAQLRERLSAMYVNDPIDAMIEWGSQIYGAAARNAQQQSAPFAGATSDLTTESFRAQQSANDPYFRHVEARFNEYVQQARPTLAQADPNTARQSLQVLYNAAKGEVLSNLAMKGQLQPPPRQTPPSYGAPSGGGQYNRPSTQTPGRVDRLGQIQSQTIADLGYANDPDFLAAMKEIDEDEAR